MTERLFVVLAIFFNKKSIEGKWNKINIKNDKRRTKSIINYYTAAACLLSRGLPLIAMDEVCYHWFFGCLTIALFFNRVLSRSVLIEYAAGKVSRKEITVLVLKRLRIN